ncbi:MAG: DUF3800 domain-containing protein [Bacteroidetes bacterium]|nr:DUF3800 domain-containing protein [Bacteroidota bacterium]
MWFIPKIFRLETTMPIYCDESGYTGVNLLDDDQLYFVYSSVNITEKKAKKIITTLRQKCNIQGNNEIKTKNLLRKQKNKNEILNIFRKYSPRVKMVVHEKKFVLACKIFEYYFEPIISKQSATFYKIGFHNYVSHLLYKFFLDGQEAVVNFFQEFQDVLRNKTEPSKEMTVDQNVDNRLRQIVEIIHKHQETFIDEVSDEKGVMNKWVLELSGSSLYNLLCAWGEKHPKGISIICDNSYALKEGMTGLKTLSKISSPHQSSTDIFGYKIALNYKLKEDIKFGDSKDFYGLQLADFFASTLSYAIKNKEDSEDNFSQKILSYYFRYSLPQRNNSFSILADPNYFNDPNSSHEYLLSRIHFHSINNTPVIEGLIQDTRHKKS